MLNRRRQGIAAGLTTPSFLLPLCSGKDDPNCAVLIDHDLCAACARYRDEQPHIDTNLNAALLAQAEEDWGR
jgi:hypothetical protein